MGERASRLIAKKGCSKRRYSDMSHMKNNIPEETQMAETASKATGTPTPVPTNKVIAGGISGAVVVIVIYVLNTYLLPNNKIPAEVSSAITVVVGFVCSYFTKPSSDQTT